MPELPLVALTENRAERRTYPGHVYPGPTTFPGVYLEGVPAEPKEEDEDTLTLTPLSES